MSFEKILVTVIGGIFIIFIYLFFFYKREKVIVAKKSTRIIVEGGYKPSIIKVKKDTTAVLNFIRRDPNGCLEELVFPDFKIKKYLPINTPVEVEIKPTKKGEFEFHCGMNMYHGKVIVE